jgi:hypothetical protein
MTSSAPRNELCLSKRLCEGRPFSIATFITGWGSPDSTNADLPSRLPISLDLLASNDSNGNLIFEHHQFFTNSRKLLFQKKGLIRSKNIQRRFLNINIGHRVRRGILITAHGFIRLYSNKYAEGSGLRQHFRKAR